MNIQIGTVPQASEGSHAPRTSTPSEPNAGREAAVAPPPAANPAVQPASTTAQSNIDAAKQIARQINDFLESSSSDVQFSVDSESDQVVVRVVDTQTKQVLRQMPSEEMLAISKSLDRMSGLLIQQKT